VELWSGLPGAPERVLGTALLSRVVPRLGGGDDDPVTHAAVAVEAFDLVIADGATHADYEACDLLYNTEAYIPYRNEHFGDYRLPSSMIQLHDMRTLSSLTVRFLWFASFIKVIS